jgi:hypothetical protein
MCPEHLRDRPLTVGSMSHAARRTPGKRPLGPTAQEQVRNLVTHHGQRATAALLGISTQTVAVLGAGFPANKAIAELVELKLTALSPASSADDDEA